MTDRVPTEILPNGAIRYGIYDAAGAFLRYEYIKPEDEPTQEGDPICKATLLDDNTCAALDIPTTSVPNDAFFILSIGNNRGLVVATVYETGTTTPIDNVLVTGIKTATGGDVYTNATGIAVGYTTTTTTTVSVSAEYVDLTVAAQTISTPFSKKTPVTLYATRKVNTGYLETTVTTSGGSYRFTNRVMADVHLVGGGYNGQSGSWHVNPAGGNGGNGGLQRFLTDIVPNPLQAYQAVVGGSNGGITSFMGLSTSGGLSGGTGGQGNYYNTSNYEWVSEKPGTACTVKKYGSGSVVASGGGGGGRANNDNNPGAAGGAPYGGKGGGRQVAAQNGSSYGGGGGGGSATNIGSGTAGGQGHQGVIWFRWRYKA